MRRTATGVGLALAVVLLGIGPIAAQQTPSFDKVVVVVSPIDVAVDLGESVAMQVTVKNNSAHDLADPTIHLDITNTDRDGSVDPEDWTPTLNQFPGSLAAGASVTVEWTIQPISPGTFTVFAVALPSDSSEVVVSNILRVDVTDQRSLNPQGILPVALMIPAGLGLLLADRHRRVRRS